MTNRILALAIAVLALAALAGQYANLPAATADLTPLAKLWLMASYFTILTNVLILGTMLARAAGARLAAGWTLMLLVAIVIVMAVYHTVLARLWAPEGPAWWADQGLHTAVPLAYAAWWLGYADKRLTWRALALCLAWPLAYCAYALIRGRLTGVWAYPFLDGDALSPARLALNIAGLTLAFAALSAAIIGLVRR